MIPSDMTHQPPGFASYTSNTHHGKNLLFEYWISHFVWETIFPELCVNTRLHKPTRQIHTSWRVSWVSGKDGARRERKRKVNLRYVHKSYVLKLGIMTLGVSHGGDTGNFGGQLAQIRVLPTRYQTGCSPKQEMSHNVLYLISFNTWWCCTYNHPEKCLWKKG